MHWVFLGAIALILILLLVNWAANAEAKTIRQAGRYLLAFLSGVLALLLATRGLFAFAGPLALLAFALATNIRIPALGGGNKTAGQKSQVETLYLRIELDHDSGDMDGEVLVGQFQGRTLSELDQGDLELLLEECREADAEGARLLDAYLARRFSGHRAQQEGAGSGASSQPDMSTQEAYDVLGLDDGATASEIKSAHRRLMKKFHPDQGGSDYFATRLNRAKEILLNL